MGRDFWVRPSQDRVNKDYLTKKKPHKKWHYDNHQLDHIWPSGRDIEVRRVEGYEEWADFQWMVEDSPNAPGVTTRYRKRTRLDGVTDTNFYVMEVPCKYFRSWINFEGMPKREVAFPDDPEPMSFEAELYEIVNSQPVGKGRGIDEGLLCIDYGGAERMCSQWQQFYQEARRKDAKHVAAAISQGLRDKELVPAIMKDFKTWLGMRPDFWPVPLTTQELPSLARFPLPITPITTIFHRLPAELLLLTLQQLEPVDLFSLAASCKSLRARIIDDRGFLDAVFKDALFNGSLVWLRPVNTVAGEEDRFNEVVRQWLALSNRSVSSTQVVMSSCTSSSAVLVDSNSMVSSTELVASSQEAGSIQQSSHTASSTELVVPPEAVSAPLSSPYFPHYAFVKSCFEEDALRNRERLWRIAKQYERLWIKYRTIGWQRHAFKRLDEIAAIKRKVEGHGGWRLENGAVVYYVPKDEDDESDGDYVPGGGNEDEGGTNDESDGDYVPGGGNDDEGGTNDDEGDTSDDDDTSDHGSDMSDDEGDTSGDEEMAAVVGGQRCGGARGRGCARCRVSAAEEPVVDDE